jgi:hypothetical protein
MKFIVRLKFKGELLRDELFNNYDSAYDYFFFHACNMTNEVGRDYAFTYKDCFCNKEREIEILEHIEI